jgi:hypothetical protein
MSPNAGEGEGWVAGSQPMSTAAHMEPKETLEIELLWIRESGTLNSCSTEKVLLHKEKRGLGIIDGKTENQISSFDCGELC